MEISGTFSPGRNASKFSCKPIRLKIDFRAPMWGFCEARTASTSRAAGVWLAVEPDFALAQIGARPDPFS